MDTLNEAVKSVNIDHSLLFAEQFLKHNHIISVQDYCKIYKYTDHGIYTQIAAPKNTGVLENMIINFKTGKSYTVAKRKNIIHNISTLAYIDHSELNPEGYICFNNGIYNIKSRELTNHDPKKYFTVHLPYDYDPNAQSEQWDTFLREALDNNLNKIRLLQEFCGYCFLKTCKFEKALFLEGAGGSGKSTFTETIKHMIGAQNASATSLSHLTDPVLRCSIRGKMVNFDSDLPEKAKEYEDIFKKITSGESIKFSEKFIPSIDEQVNCKLIFNVNEFPYIKDTSNAFYRRMILIKFNQNFYDRGADINLKEKLCINTNLSAIFNWCMHGLDRLIHNNKFSINIDMDHQINELKMMNNPILQFISEEITFNINNCVNKKAIWERYKEWSISNGHRYVLSHIKFNKLLFEELRKHNVTHTQKTNDDRCRGWKNIDCEMLDFSHKWFNDQKEDTESPTVPINLNDNIPSDPLGFSAQDNADWEE